MAPDTAPLTPCQRPRLLGEPARPTNGFPWSSRVPVQGWHSTKHRRLRFQFESRIETHPENSRTRPFSGTVTKHSPSSPPAVHLTARARAWQSCRLRQEEFQTGDRVGVNENFVSVAQFPSWNVRTLVVVVRSASSPVRICRTRTRLQLWRPRISPCRRFCLAY